MEDKLIKGAVILASGVVAVKALKAVRYYKMQKDAYKAVEDSATDEKQLATKTCSFMKGVVDMLNKLRDKFGKKDRKSNEITLDKVDQDLNELTRKLLKENQEQIEKFRKEMGL